MALAGEQLNPAQQAVIDALGATGSARPTFAPGLRDELRAALEEGLSPVVAQLPEDDDLYLTKHALAAVHGCEDRFLADRDHDFDWSAATARGTVSHRAIELSLNWRGAPAPMALVDESLARLAGTESGLGDWLQRVSEVERAELRSVAGDHVTKFLECFPPLQPRWRPVCEARLRQELCGDRVVLTGRADLTIGHARGTTAGKVIIDLKTGGFAPVHVDDLRFYALVETLRIGVPPRRLATYYLDSGRLVPEDVTEAMLRSTVGRVVDGAARIVALRSGSVEPVTRPGPVCRWCSLRPGCGPGQAHLVELDERAGW